MLLANRILALALCLIAFQPLAFGDNGTKTRPYLLQPGDVLGISVWKEENLQRELIIRPDGAISFPLIGQTHAAGRSVTELQGDIENQLQKFIPDPVVSVDVRDFGGNKVYVIGKVQRPGPFQVAHYLDVVQALSMAGGMSTYAAVNKIRILRRVDGELRAIPFEYGDIEKGENLEQNIVLQPGDVVVVP